MAAVTVLGTTFNTTAGSHTVTATPAVGDLIILVVANTGYTGTVLPTDNNADGLGTYTLVNSCVKATSADTMQVYVRNSLVGSATSTVFTHAAPGTTTGGGLSVLKVTGMAIAGSSAIARSGIQSNQASGTPAVALGAAANTNNPLIGAVFSATNSTTTQTQPTGWTERFDNGYATPTAGLEVATIDSGFTNSTVTWGAASGSAFCAIAVELQAPRVDLTISLVQGTTVLASWAHTTLGTTITQFDQTLTGAQAANITNYSDLRLRAVATGVGGARAQLTWTELEVPAAPVGQDTPELRGRPFGITGQRQMQQLLAQ